MDCDQGQRDAVLKQIQLIENPRRSGSAWSLRMAAKMETIFVKKLIEEENATQ